MIDAMIAVVTSAAKAASVPPTLLLAICTVESNLNPHAVNVHDGGSASYGLCQLKVATAKQFDKRASPEMLLEPKDNARIAALYLRFNIGRYYTTQCAVASYNAGSCRRNESGVIRNIKYVRKVEKHRKVYDQILNGGRSSVSRDQRYRRSSMAR